MNLENMKKEELELLSFTDLTEMILKESKKSLNTPTIFKKICNLLGLTDNEYQEKIGDYYTSLTTDKRFLLLENAEWDLKDRHKLEIIIDDEDMEESDEEEIEEENEDEIEEQEDNIDEDVLDDESLDDEDDLEDLSIISDEESDDE